MYKSNSEYQYEFLSNESLILIKDSFYVQTVLGIKLPLNESYTSYSPVLLEQIIQEQLILEDFYETLKKWVDKGKESVGKVIDVIKSPADIAILLKNLIDNPKLLSSVNETYRNKINNFVKDFKDKLTSIVDLLKKPIELLKGLKSDGNQNIEEGISFYQEFIDGLLGYITKVTDFLNKNITDGWSGLLKAIVFNGALSYINDKINFYVKKITGVLKMVVNPIDFLKDTVQKEIKDTKKGLSDGLKNNLSDLMSQLGNLAKDSFDKVNSFFTGIAGKYKWMWTATIGYLSSIAKEIAPKIKKAGTNNKFDLTHYGRLTRDLKKIESFKRNTVKIINEKSDNLKITDIYNKNIDMSNLNKIIKQGLNNLLETKGFEDMEVAFGVKQKSDNLSDAEKGQFGTAGQLKKNTGGTFTNPKVPGTTIVDKVNNEGGKDAQAYYKEVAKKIKDYQAPNDSEKFVAPKVPTNTDGKNERLETTGYDVGVSGTEVTADLAAEKGGSEATKKVYKDRLEKLNGKDATYEKMKKNAKDTNELKYKKDAQNTRPVKAQTSKQNESFIKEDVNMSADPQKLMTAFNNFVAKKYPQLVSKIDTAREKAEVISAFAKAFGIEASQLGKVKSILDKQPEEQTEKMEENVNYEGVDSKNIFKANGKLVSESQVLKLVDKIPSRVKIDETTFAITDGENTYKLIWEGDTKTGEATITNFRNKQAVNEDIQKMKYLWGFKTSDSISTKKNITESGEDAFKRLLKLVKEDKSSQLSEWNTPIRNVVDDVTKKHVGTHQHGKGFAPNEHGMELGHEAHPTDIPKNTNYHTDDYLPSPFNYTPKTPKFSDEGVYMGSSVDEDYMDYEESGLENPEKADLDKDKDINPYEKKRGSAIEKNMKKS